MRKIIIIGTMLIMSSIAFAEESVIPVKLYEAIYPKYPDSKDTLLLRKSFKGNFTNSGYDECIAFYYVDTPSGSLYDEAVVYVVKNKKIINRYNIVELVFQEYGKFPQGIIKSLEGSFGSWNGYYYQYDLNKNGIKELILFPYAGVGLSIKIYEFKDGRFVSLADTDGQFISKISVDIQKNSFTIYGGYEYEAHKNGYLVSPFIWNSQKGKYEMVKKEKGVILKK